MATTTPAPIPNFPNLGNIRSYFNWRPRIAAHFMQWFDPTSKSHLPVGYDSSDPRVITAQLDSMHRSGVDVVAPDYYGTVNTFQMKVVTQLISGCQARGMTVAPCFDGGMVKRRPDMSVSATSYMISQMKWWRDQYGKLPTSERLADGRMLAMAFSWNSSDARYDIDESAVAKAMPEFAILFRDAGGFTKTGSAGAFSWVNTDHQAFLTKAAAAPTKIACGSISRGFDDHYRWPGGDVTKSCWNYPNDPARLTPERDGQFLLDTVSIYNSSTYKPPYIQLATWNDHEEGTDLEWGFDSRVTLSMSLMADPHGVISIMPIGNIATVDHVALQIGGMEYPVLTTQFDLSMLGLGDGTYEFTAVAKPRPLFWQKTAKLTVTRKTTVVTTVSWS
jgi:hypothetical protein